MKNRVRCPLCPATMERARYECHIDSHHAEEMADQREYPLSLEIATRKAKRKDKSPNHPEMFDTDEGSYD